jgi:hypothetical protein
MIDEPSGGSSGITYDEWLKKEGLYKLIKDDPSIAAATLALQNFRDSVEPTNMGIIDEIKRDFSYPLDSIRQELNKVKIENLQPQEVWDALFKEVLKLAYSQKSIDVNSFNDLERVRLREIANYCPYTFGNAVYSARALLLVVDGPEVHYQNDCEVLDTPEHTSARLAQPKMEDILPKLNNTKNDDVISANIIPNPNNGSFKIQYNSKEKSNLNLKICNVTGEEIELVVLDVNKQIYYYINSRLANGVYAYFIYSDNSVIAKGKFVVLK